MPIVPSSTNLHEITASSVALQQTRFSSWFPRYRRHTPKATIIDLLSLQADFLDWLEEDGIILPEDSEEEQRQYSSNHGEKGQEEEILDDDDDDDDDDGEEEDSTTQPRNFDCLNEKIRQVIAKYDGAVFPKLDWSAPLDAAWIVPGSTLRCTSPSDIYMLLKSSDFVSKDVKQLRELDEMQQLANESSVLRSTTVRPMLVLKKFFSIPTSHEFRCFVRAGQFLCISQRDCGTYFEHLQDSTTTKMMRQLLHSFFQTVLDPSRQENGDSHGMHSPPFPFPIQDFVWDAYISRDMSKVYLVDINPYLGRTDSLLWTWDEIEDIAERRKRGQSISEGDDDDEESSEEETIMRVYTDGRESLLLRANGIEDDRGSRGSQRHSLPLLRTINSRAQTTQSCPTYARNMVPSDVVGAAEGNSIAEFAREWNDRIAQAMRGNQKVGSDRDDDDDDDDDDGDIEQPSLLPGR